MACCRTSSLGRSENDGLSPGGAGSLLDDAIAIYNFNVRRNKEKGCSDNSYIGSVYFERYKADGKQAEE